MRNKIFVILCTVIFLAFFAGAPLFLLLTSVGVLPYQNVGNQIKAEKTYREDHPLYGVLTAIERGKMAIKDTYINYLPGFLNITNSFKPLKSSIDRPMLDWLAAKGREITGTVCRHVYDEETVVPTCTEAGYTRIVCRLCGESDTKDQVPARGHIYGEGKATVAVGCTNDGYTPVPCLYCSETRLDGHIPATGHNYVLISERAADCDTEGSMLYRCTGCMDTVTVTIPSAHRYSVASVSPDLGERAVRHACRDCGKSFYTSLDEETGHTHQKTRTVVEGGCDAVSYVHTACDVCGDAWVRDIVLPTGHTYTTTVIGATCTEGGYTHRACTACADERDIFEISALGHRYSVQTVAPTVYEEGYDLHSCNYCTSVLKTNYVPRLILGIELPGTTPDPVGTTYSASLLAKNAMFRIYELSAAYPDGTRDSSIVRVIAHDRDGLRQNMLETAEFMNAMVEARPEVNWYFSFATNIEAIPLGDRFFPEESVADIYEDFLDLLPSSVKTAELAVNSFKDYAAKFYVTDHHWNYTGVQEAYYRILSMMRENYSDLSPMPFNDLYVFDDVKFYGSLARSSAKYSDHDDFGIYFYDLPAHELTIDQTIAYGSQKTLSENLDIYLEGLYETKKGYNHYTEFYRVPSEIVYPENNTGRRLLVIGDSYSLPLIELVAANFDVTYVRYEDRGFDALPDDLYLDEFVEEHGITDVLVIEEPVKVVMKGYGTYYPSGFINIYPYRAYKDEED